MSVQAPEDLVVDLEQVTQSADHEWDLALGRFIVRELEASGYVIVREDTP